MSERHKPWEFSARSEVIMGWLALLFIIYYCSGEGSEKLKLPVSVNNWGTCPSHWLVETDGSSPSTSQNDVSFDESMVALASFVPELDLPVVRQSSFAQFLDAFHTQSLQEIPIFHAVNNGWILKEVLAFPCQVIVDFDLLSVDNKTMIRHSRDDLGRLQIDDVLRVVQENPQLLGVHFDPKNAAALEDIISKVNEITDRYVFINSSLADGPGGGQVEDDKRQNLLSLMSHALEERDPDSPPLVLMANWETKQAVFGQYDLSQMIEITSVLGDYRGPVIFAVDVGYFLKNPEVIDHLLKLAWENDIDAWGIKLYSSRELQAEEFHQVERAIAQSDNLHDRVLYELTVDD